MAGWRRRAEGTGADQATGFLKPLIPKADLSITLRQEGGKGELGFADPLLPHCALTYPSWLL